MKSRPDISGATTSLNDLNVQPSSSMPMLAFTAFPKLPIELRLQVWQHAISNIKPRLVSMKFNALGNYVPNILHANSEARTEARKRYECGALQSTGIRVDYESDIPIVNHFHQWTLNELHEDHHYRDSLFADFGAVFNYHKIRRVAFRFNIQRIPIIYPGEPGYNEHTCLWQVLERLFPNLEEIIFLLAPEVSRMDLTELIQRTGSLTGYAIRQITDRDYRVYMNRKDEKARYWTLRFLEPPPTIKEGEKLTLRKSVQ